MIETRRRKTSRMDWAFANLLTKVLPSSFLSFLLPHPSADDVISLFMKVDRRHPRRPLSIWSVAMVRSWSCEPHEFWGAHLLLLLEDSLCVVIYIYLPSPSCFFPKFLIYFILFFYLVCFLGLTHGRHGQHGGDRTEQGRAIQEDDSIVCNHLWCGYEPRYLLSLLCLVHLLRRPLSSLINHFSFLISHFSFLISHFSFLISHFSFLISYFSSLLSPLSLYPLSSIPLSSALILNLLLLFHPSLSPCPPPSHSYISLMPDSYAAGKGSLKYGWVMHKLKEGERLGEHHQHRHLPMALWDSITIDAPRHRTWPLGSSQVCLPLLLIIHTTSFRLHTLQTTNQLITSFLFFFFFRFSGWIWWW